MKKFFGRMFASFFGMMLFTLVSIFVFIAMIAGSIASSEKIETVKDSSVLEIKLSQPIVDNPNEDIMGGLNSALMGQKTEKGVALRTVLDAIYKAKNDDKIKGIVIDAGLGDGQGIATMQEVRDALKCFKDSSDKFIYAYGEMYSQSGYYLSSIADKIYMQNEGGVDVRGISLQLQFFKKLMDKVGVEMQIIRHGKFKSAVEPFINEKMSDENREQYSLLANSTWNEMLADIAEGRNLSEARVNEIADSLLALDGKTLVGNGIIDQFMERDYFNDTILKDMHLVSVSKYNSSVKEEKKESKDRIAVIYAQGEVGMGKGSIGEIGTENISSAIKKAANNKNVKAIVLRVNSPGGSVLTSDIIYRAVVEAKKKKPVVASYGTYAASGGYYISCAANKIYSDPTTLTGSIGVFGMIPNAQKLLTEKIGLTFDEVKTNANSGMGNLTRPMTDFEKNTIQQSIEDIYFGFISKVAEGRGKTVEYIDSIGQGRVWTGLDALRIGLVDELGGLTAAIKGAAELAEISEYRISEYPEQKDPMTQFMELLGQSSNARLQKELARTLGLEGAAMYKALQQTQEAGEMQVYARMPFGIIVE